MIKTCIVTKKQTKMLVELFDALGVDLDGLLEIKNISIVLDKQNALEKENESFKERLEFMEKTMTLQNEIIANLRNELEELKQDIFFGKGDNE